MAFIVSSLSISDQAAHLRQFLATRNAALSDTTAQNVCRSIELHKPGESKTFGRKLVAALAAHGVVIKHSNALEALARMCGQPSWMRTLQASLPFGDTAAEKVAYGLQATKDGERLINIEAHASMSDATDRMVKLLAAIWPAAESVCQATLGMGKQMLVVELEHPSAPWLTFTICRFNVAGEQTELSDLPPQESLAFCERITRTLEYTYPGLLVLNSMRSSTLGPQYYLCPEVRRLDTGDTLTCWADLEFLPVLDGFRGKPNATMVAGVLRFDSDDGPIEVKPLWTSNTDQRHLPGGLSPEQLNSLLNRLARLRRLTGGSVTQHFGKVMTGALTSDSTEGHFPIDKDAMEKAMAEVNLTAKQLALLAEVPLNVIQRVQKYGFAHEELVPKLADALGLAHPNALLPLEKDQGVGLRIEDGETFLTTLRKTHMWRRVLGESLQGQELHEVNRIAEELQEYVEVLQFSVNPASATSPEFVAAALEPVDEARLAEAVQELLDDLATMAVAVIVSNDLRFAGGTGRLQGMNGMPLRQGTLFFEKVSALKSPRSRDAASA